MLAPCLDFEQSEARVYPAFARILLCQQQTTSSIAGCPETSSHGVELSVNKIRAGHDGHAYPSLVFNSSNPQKPGTGL